jgi:glycosyltransferase involved in cell wall biosynthesis
MKIALITGGDFHLTYGGIQTHVYYLAKYLCKAGEDIQIMLLTKNSQGEKYYKGIEDWCHIVKAGLPERGFDSHLHAAIYHWIRILSFNLHSLIKLLSMKTDVIHYHYAPHCYDGLFIPILRLFVKKPIIATFHCMGIKYEYEHNPHKTLRARFAYALGLIFEKALGASLNYVITLAPTDFKNSLCVPQGIDLGEFSFIKRNDYQRYVYIGRMDPNKSVMGLATAFHKISDDFPGKLVLIGDGSQLGEIRDYVRNNFSDGRVEILGPISNVGEELKKGGIFILFSQFEGFSVSTLEAMAAGLPTIITPVGANRFYFEDGKHTLFVKPGDIDDLAKKMLIYYRNKGLADQIRQEANDFVREKFSWYHVSAQTLELYQQLTTSKEKVTQTAGIQDGFE